MKKIFLGSKRVITALGVGMTLFFIGCQTNEPFQERMARESLINQFERAENYWYEKDYDLAINAYEAYLGQNPHGKKVPLSTFRIGQIYIIQQEYRQALAAFNSIQSRFPRYTSMDEVKHQMIRSLYFLEEYHLSIQEAEQWLSRFSSPAIKGHIYTLLGDNWMALEDNSQAFDWYFKAKKNWDGKPERLAEINSRLEQLIAKCELDDLEKIQMSTLQAEDKAKIYHRLAGFFLKQNELKKAMQAAMALVFSTPEQTWVTIGRQMMDRIREEQSVKSNVIGCLLPLSGAFAVFGEESLNGIQLGLDLFGKHNNIPDLELVIRDTYNQEEKAVSGLESLVHDEKVIAVIGPLFSKTSVAVAQKAQKLGVPLITLTQKQGITETGEMIFRNFLTPEKEVKRLLDVAMDKKGIKRFGILYPDNSYGKFYRDLFWDELEAKGGVVTAVEAYASDQTDFATQIKKIAGLYYPKPESFVEELIANRTPEQEEMEIFPEEPAPIIDFEAVFIPDNFQKAALVTPQLIYHDVMGVLLMGTSLWQSQKLIQMAEDYVQGAIFPAGFVKDMSRPDVKNFVKNYMNSFDAVPGILAAAGYDTIRLVKKIIGRDDVRTRIDFKDALLKEDEFAGVTCPIVFDTDGDLLSDPFLLTVSGRKIIPYD